MEESNQHSITIVFILCIGKNILHQPIGPEKKKKKFKKNKQEIKANLQSDLNQIQWERIAILKTNIL